MVSMGLRAMSVSPQATVDVAAATMHWMSKTISSSLETVLGYDIPRLAVYSHAIQREADPTHAYAVAKGQSFLDESAGLPLCGLAGAPTGAGPYVWLVGGASPAGDPVLLTVTHVYGLPTADQLINGICTLWNPTCDPVSGRDLLEWEVVGTPVTPISAPTPAMPVTSIQRAGQTVVQRNGSGQKVLSYSLKLTQPADPLYTTPLTSGSETFVLPDEMESDGVLGELDVMWKLLTYTGSSLEKARTSVTEAWIATFTRGSNIIVITTPVVQPTKAAPDDSKPRQRQTSSGPVLYDTGISGLATVSIAGGTLTYAAT